MNLILATLVLLAGQAKTSFPGGTVTIPQGCAAPEQVRELIDAFLGSIECAGEKLTIAVFGGSMVGPGCRESSEAPPVKLLLPSGHAITVCATERKAARSGRLIKELVIDLGPAWLFAEVREPRDAILMLEIASTFEPESPR